MKPQTVNPVVLTARCTYHTATGRRCRLPVSDAHSSLCRQHRAELLAQNRISPRRAAVLSYISSLLLRTLPQIDADNSAGIVYRAKPVPIDVPVADEIIDSGADPELDPAPEPHKPRASDSANTWNPAIPEPDPTKKPS